MVLREAANWVVSAGAFIHSCGSVLNARRFLGLGRRFAAVQQQSEQKQKCEEGVRVSMQWSHNKQVLGA